MVYAVAVCLYDLMLSLCIFDEIRWHEILC